MESTSSKKYVAELLGTFSLVLFGTGAAVLAGANMEGIAPSGVGLLGIALAFGLSVVVMAYAIGPISGCHINPAISVSMWVAGKLSGKDTLGYIISQSIGAVLASGVLFLLASGKSGFALGDYALGANGWGDAYLGKYSMASAFLGEMVFTFLFLCVIFGTTSSIGNSGMAGLAIGFTLVLIHLVLIPVTGTSVNPARSLGPAIFAGGAALSQLWLFWVAPILGGVLAALLWKYFFDPKKA